MKKLTDHPDFATASDKLTNLKIACYEAEALRTELFDQLNRVRNLKEPIDPLVEQAEKLMAGDKAEKPALSTDNLRGRLEQAAHSVKVHNAAINLQQQKVEALRSKYSVEICGKAEGEYKKLVKAAVAAAAELSKAYAAVQAFRDNLADGGIIIALPDIPAHIGALGRWDNPGSNVHLAIDDATQAGFVNGEYEGRPQQPSPHNDIPTGKSFAALAAGPDGIRLVDVSRGGEVKTKKWISKTEKDRDTSESAWTA